MNTSNLRLLHRIHGEGAEMGNVKIYCQSCFAARMRSGQADENVADVSRDTKDRALRRAGHRCECTSAKGCH